MIIQALLIVIVITLACLCAAIVIAKQLRREHGYDVVEPIINSQTPAKRVTPDATVIWNVRWPIN